MFAVDLIDPFIEATLDATRVMATVSPRKGRTFTKVHRQAKGDISGIVGFDGALTGSVAVTLPGRLALRIYEGMVGEPPTGLTREVQDAIGELANLIAGGAKATLARQGHAYRLALPTIVVGPNHLIEHKGTGPSVVVPFFLDDDTFWLEVNVEVPPTPEA